MSIEMCPIGIIHSPFKTMADAPHQGANINNVAQIELYPEFEGGLKDIEGFSHILVIYVFDQSKGYKLNVLTPWDDIPHGVFASRSQNRPNPIGVSVVKLTGRNGRVLNTTGMDALDGSPVLDIKPYVPAVDYVSRAKFGWLENSSSFNKIRIGNKETSSE
jgi:tRNA-Thr(GGU) m(6)t(6)A37 methyltransferase TsaA